jgi:acyl carrier protein phosphodiesterase
MNYLAHLYLAESEDPESLIGNLMGDFVKGRVSGLWTPGLRRGILRHRKIDAFTDGHAVVKTSKRRIRPELRRYAGVLVDVFYDHFLAKHWRRYSSTPLRNFSWSAYRILATHYDFLPASMQRSVSYMIANDLLMTYREITGIQRALLGIQGRLKRPGRLAEGVTDLRRNYAPLATDFAVFFPELIDYSASLTREQLI